MSALLQFMLVMISAVALAMCVLGMVARRRARTQRSSTFAPAGPDPIHRTGTSKAESRNDSHSSSEMWARPGEPALKSDGSVSEYRVRPGGSQVDSHWDPFAEDQSRGHRVRAARRKPRPSRAGGPVTFSSLSEDGRIDHYSLLGVRRDATEAEIEAAYRRYAAEIHPDRFFDDPARRAHGEEKLKQLNAIMQILRDPTRRARYDASR